MTVINKHTIQRYFPLLIAAFFVIGWTIARDCIQSITIDEADTYVYFASGQIHSQWEPHSNNHLLNTILIHLFTSVFGLHNFTMRMPALIGAIVYIFSVFQLCLIVLRNSGLQLLLFVCLVYNPFMMDYFVAARGYSLAVGFLLFAILNFCRLLMACPSSLDRLYRASAIASLCLGVSFTSNFSFAFVDAWTVTLFFLWIWQLDRTKESAAARSRENAPALRIGLLAIACTLPGIIWAFLIAGWTIAKWPKGQLVYGANSLLEVWRGIIQSCFFEMNPQILNPMLYKWFTGLSRYLPYLAALLIVLVLVQVLMGIWQSKYSGKILSNRTFLFELYLAAVVVSTLLTHWIAFHVAGLLMPEDRTGIFFVPLITLTIGISCAMGGMTRAGIVMRRARVVLLLVGAVSFVACLRLSYFQLWKFDADIQGAYEALVETEGTGKYIEVPCYFLYTSALNFYREYYHDNSFQYFYLTFRGGYKPGKQAYVLLLPQDQAFLDRQHLKTVFHGKKTDLVVAIREH